MTMMNRTILSATAALALLALPALPALPALAADPTTNSLNVAWGDSERAHDNLRNALLVVLQERDALAAQVRDLRNKCGAPCAAASSDATTTPPPAPPADATPPAPTAAPPASPEAPKP